MLVYVIYKPLSQIVYENSNSSYVILYIYFYYLVYCAWFVY